MKLFNSVVQPILVAACGNSLAGDDAFGPSVADRLRQERSEGLAVVDLGMKPAGLLDQLDGRIALIIVDAALPVGPELSHELIDRDIKQGRVPSLVHDIALSSHGLSIAHELALAQTLDLLPERVHLIAAEAQYTGMGEPMSRHVRQLVAPAARRIVRLAEAWLSERADQHRLPTAQIMPPQSSSGTHESQASVGRPGSFAAPQSAGPE